MAIQLAAYARLSNIVVHHDFDIRLLSVAISTTNPGEIEYREWTDWGKYYTMFENRLNCWIDYRNFDSRQTWPQEKP